MSRSPLVSVVMPVYRPNPHFLRAAIASVLSQTFSDLELIIVEDPSDRTGTNVVASFEDSRVRYLLNTERTSLVRQHNTGMHRTRGTFICRFDADDINEPSRLQREIEFLKTNPDCDVVGTWLLVIDESDRVVGVRRYPIKHESIVAAMRSYNPVANSSVMFRRELLSKYGDRSEEVLAAEDYEWYSRLASAGARFATLPEYLVRYRLHDESMKSTRLKLTIRHTLAVKKAVWRNSMSLRDRCVMLVEQALLAVPDVITLAAFRWLRYARSGSSPMSPPPSSQ